MFHLDNCFAIDVKMNEFSKTGTKETGALFLFPSEVAL